MNKTSWGIFGTLCLIAGFLLRPVACPEADASYLPIEKAGVFASMSVPCTLVVDTALVFEALPGTFINNPIENFTVVSSPVPGICYMGSTRWFKVSWSGSVAGDANGITAYHGIGVNATAPDSLSIMHTFMKTAGEDFPLVGEYAVYLDSGDVVSLVGSASSDNDELYFQSFNTSIVPFFVREL